MNTERLTRALRAAQAVTLGSAALVAGCGTTPVVPDPDGGTDVGADVEADVTVCSGTVDEVCGEGCTADNDADCCAQREPAGWCSFSPDYGCSCAVEGPFAPPSVARLRGAFA